MKKILLIIALLISSIAIGQKAIELNGQIRVFNTLPKVWNNTINFRASTESDLYALGFRDIVKPSITEYQRYGALLPEHLANEVYIYPVIDFTQAEIDSYDQRQLDNDSSANKLINYRSDGEIWNKRIWDRIMREYDSGNLTENQFNTISNSLFDAILPLNFGQWKIAKSRVDALPIPSNAKLLAILNKTKQIIDDYITENY